MCKRKRASSVKAVSAWSASLAQTHVASLATLPSKPSHKQLHLLSKFPPPPSKPEKLPVITMPLFGATTPKLLKVGWPLSQASLDSGSAPRHESRPGCRKSRGGSRRLPFLSTAGALEQMEPRQGEDAALGLCSGACTRMTHAGCCRAGRGGLPGRGRQDGRRRERPDSGPMSGCTMHTMHPETLQSRRADPIRPP